VYINIKEWEDGDFRLQIGTAAYDVSREDLAAIDRALEEARCFVEQNCNDDEDGVNCIEEEPHEDQAIAAYCAYEDGDITLRIHGEYHDLTYHEAGQVIGLEERVEYLAAREASIAAERESFLALSDELYAGRND